MEWEFSNVKKPAPGIQRKRVIGIDMSFLFGGVIVLVRQGFPFQKFFLAGKVLAGQADDDFIGVHINDGIGVFLIV